MRAEGLQSYQKAKPFRPYQIRMNSGQTYEVRHPEMLRMGHSAMLYFRYDAEGFYLEWEMLSLDLVESVKHLETATAGSTEGQGA
jgi:hypothetical protein